MNTAPTTDHTALIDPMVMANELISLGDRATDEGRDAAPYLNRAEAIINWYEAGDDANAAHLVRHAVAWLAS